MIVTRLFVNKVDRFCKVKTIGDYDPGMIVLDLYHNRFVICERVYLPVIYNYPYVQDTEQYLFLPANYDIIK